MAGNETPPAALCEPVVGQAWDGIGGRLMNKKWRYFWGTGLTVLLLAGCSVNPEKRKQSYLQAGMRLMKQERYAAAAVQFQNALKLDPRFVDALYHYSQVQVFRRDWVGAYASLQRAIELDPKRLDARVSLAQLMLGSGNYKGAEDQANVVLK